MRPLFVILRQVGAGRRLSTAHTLPWRKNCMRAACVLASAHERRPTRHTPIDLSPRHTSARSLIQTQEHARLQPARARAKGRER
eukprot:155340-Chlamydomonas_euryale.AAC.8